MKVELFLLVVARPKQKIEKLFETMKGYISIIPNVGADASADTKCRGY